jgi:hypothetical protein
VIGAIRLLVFIYDKNTRNAFKTPQSGATVLIEFEYSTRRNRFPVDAIRLQNGNSFYPPLFERETSMLAWYSLLGVDAAAPDADPCATFSKPPSLEQLYLFYEIIPGEHCEDCCPSYGPPLASFANGGGDEYHSVGLGSCIWCPNALNIDGRACQSMTHASEGCIGTREHTPAVYLVFFPHLFSIFIADSSYKSTLVKEDESYCTQNSPPLPFQEKFRAFRGTYNISLTVCAAFFSLLFYCFSKHFFLPTLFKKNNIQRFRGC